jgi:hypothetical protein
VAGERGRGLVAGGRRAGQEARCRRPASGDEARRACAVEAARGRGAGVGRGLGRASVGDRGAIRARPRGAIVGLGRIQ